MPSTDIDGGVIVVLSATEARRVYDYLREIAGGHGLDAVGAQSGREDRAATWDCRRWSSRMSRTKKGAKGPGYEYWSRRPAKGCVRPRQEEQDHYPSDLSVPPPNGNSNEEKLTP